MTRLRVLGALLGVLAWGAAPTAAQAPTGSRVLLYFSDLEGTSDSAFATPAGSTFDARVWAYDNAYGHGVGAFTLRVYYDPAVVSFVSARSSCPDSLTYPLQAPVLGSSYVELSATGCVSAGGFVAYQHAVVTATFSLAGGATAGSGLHVEPRTLIDRTNGADRSGDGDGDVDEVCLAVGLWGDVDDDTQVNSRDALIALSNAVGLPTPGFSVARGDVDADGYVGSRDALAMLSASIGYPPASGFRTGKGIATACAPQLLLPRTAYYVRGGASPGVAGVSGLVIRAAGDSAESIVGAGALTSAVEGQGVRVSPNGAYIVFVCAPQGYYDICRANADGSGLVNLTQGTFNNSESPDWSPGSDSIAFVRSSQIWVMAADGSNPHPIVSSPGALSVAWAPGAGSRRIAYATSSYPGQLRTRDVDSATTDSLVFDFASTSGWTNYGYYPRRVDWSPAGDSLVFSLFVDGYGATLVAPRAGGTPTRTAAVGNGAATITWPVWTDVGILFASYQAYPGSPQNRVFLRRPDGRVERLRRPDTQYNFAPGMAKQ